MDEDPAQAGSSEFCHSTTVSGCRTPERRARGSPRTFGVEQESLLVDPADGQPRAIAAALLGAGDVAHDGEVEKELHLRQVETGGGTSRCGHSAVQVRLFGRVWTGRGPGKP